MTRRTEHRPRDTYHQYGSGLKTMSDTKSRDVEVRAQISARNKKRVPVTLAGPRPTKSDD